MPPDQTSSEGPARPPPAARQSRPAPDFVAWFRACAPYINAHRGRVFVIQFDGEAIAGEHFAPLLHDIALLHMLGVRVVLVHGARPQIEATLSERGIDSAMLDGVRVTDDQTLHTIMEVVGAVRVRIEALLSMGVANSPMAGARIRIHAGNFVTARPLGVRNGIDYSHTGEVRRVDAAAISRQLDHDAMVLISPIGYSPTGEVFNLNSTDLATRVALDTGAAKLIFLAGGIGLAAADGTRIGELTLDQARRWLTSENADHNPAQRPTQRGDSAHQRNARLVSLAVNACQGGVDRVHLIDRALDGALLHELYTRDGSGTMINADPYDSIRTASIEDVGGIIELIEPLENQGLLVKRSRDKLESDIAAYTVVERDGAVIGCAAIHHFEDPDCAELACFAIADNYRISGIGGVLLEAAEERAWHGGASRLFVLTTQAAQWFKERGFQDASTADLPTDRRGAYNAQRNSRVLTKVL